jgi:hypothetical protein
MDVNRVFSQMFTLHSVQRVSKEGDSIEMSRPTLMGLVSRGVDKLFQPLCFVLTV